METYLNIWRYSINEGDFGGIVFADTIESAEKKLKNKYGNVEVLVWRILNDDYFDTENPDVWECYGF